MEESKPENKTREDIYKANFSNHTTTLNEGDIELQLYARLLEIKTSCDKCLAAQNKHGKYPFTMPFQDRATIESQNIEVGSVKYNSQNLKKGAKEFRNACISENCEYANSVAKQMFEDNERVIEELKRKQLEEKSKKPIY